jgi:hypothetical protein
MRAVFAKKARLFQALSEGMGVIWVHPENEG